jgi:hypothetical protein
MKKEFVTYKIAKKLKELNFNTECFATYHPSGEIISLGITRPVINIGIQNSFLVTAPLWQQAIDWLREEHKMLIKPSCINNELIFIVYDISTGKEKRLFSRESIEKLIEDALELLKK